MRESVNYVLVEMVHPTFFVLCVILHLKISRNGKVFEDGRGEWR